jgi:hypothetical protein
MTAVEVAAPRGAGTAIEDVGHAPCLEDGEGGAGLDREVDAAVFAEFVAYLCHACDGIARGGTASFHGCVPEDRSTRPKGSSLRTQPRQPARGSQTPTQSGCHGNPARSSGMGGEVAAADAGCAR